MRWVFENGVTRIYIDNFREVKHRDPRLRQEAWEANAETVRVMRDFADRYEIPVGFLIHDTEDDPRPGHEGPPNPKKMQGGQDAGARARLVLGMWSKGDTIRVTVTKGNDLSAAGMNGPTLEFKRNHEAATFDPDGGRIINLHAEAAEQRKEKKANADLESVEARERREALKKKREAERKAQEPEKPVIVPPPAQPSLLDVPASKKPEGS
jgi:hypothetical protein